MKNQKLSELFMKANSIKVPKFTSQSQKKQIDHRYQQFVIYQNQQISALKLQMRKLFQKLKQLEKKPLNTKITKFSQQNIKIRQKQLNNNLKTIHKQIQHEQTAKTNALINKIDQLHYKNLHTLQNKTKILTSITNQQQKNKKQLAIIKNSHEKQLHRILDEIITEQNQQIQEIVLMENKYEDSMRRLQEEILGRVNKWVKQCREKRSKIIKGLEKIIEQTDYNQ